MADASTQRPVQPTMPIGTWAVPTFSVVAWRATTCSRRPSLVVGQPAATLGSRIFSPSFPPPLPSPQGVVHVADTRRTPLTS